MTRWDATYEISFWPQTTQHGFLFGSTRWYNSVSTSEPGLVGSNPSRRVSILFVFAEYGYVMENGRVVLDGPANVLIDNEDIKEFYLGLSQVGGKKSFREVKHYKRRKRWLA
jgi:branched-chain amino acid transport system ATP-binding protein